jgi:hypothetical protein
MRGLGEMTIDISKIKPGDKVTLVPLEVVEAPTGSNSIGLRLSRSGVIYVVPDQIAAHHPAPREIGVGDRVKASDGFLGTVRAVDESEAWVRWDGHDANWSAQIPEITLVEGGE